MSKKAVTAADFPQRLADLRKQHSLTQAQLAERIGLHVVQLRRYEAGTSQPTLDVIRKLSLHCSTSECGYATFREGRMRPGGGSPVAVRSRLTL